jgi:hypothetical protein
MVTMGIHPTLVMVTGIHPTLVMVKMGFIRQW